MDVKGSVLTVFIVGLVVLNVSTVTAQGNTTFSLTTSNNGHLGTQFTLNCAFTYSNTFTIARSVHFYRKRQNDPDFAEIARAQSQDSPVYNWNDTALRDRSTFQMISRTQFQITVKNLECRDRAEYRCKYFAQDQDYDYNIFSEPEQLEITAPPRVPELTFSPSDIVENEPVQFSCTGNVGLPAGSLRILVVKSNGQEVDLNANQGLVEVEVNGCTFERTATASFNFTAEDDDRSRVRCRVEQTYADNQHRTETEPLRVIYAPRSTVMKRSVDNGNNEAISPGQTVEVPVKSNVLLTCETQSSPAALYEWSFILTGTNDTTIDSPTNSGQLRLDSIALGKSGQYRCKVSNNIRNVTYTDEVFFKLNVSSIPTIPPTKPDPTTTPSETNPGDTSTKSGQNKEDDKTGTIVGAVVGSILAVIIVIIIIIVILKYRRNPKERIQESPNKPRNNQDIPKVVVHPHLVTSGDKYDKYNKGFEKNEKELEYADLKFDDTPRSRKPVQILYEPTNYAEVAWPRV